AEEKVLCRGVFCVHPSWSLTRNVAVPRAGAREIREYLALQVERQQALARGGEILWDYAMLPDRTSSEARQAVLVMCMGETLRPIEQAFRDCGIPTVLATISPLSAYACLRRHADFPDGPRQVIVHLSDDGANVLETADDVVTYCSWMPADDGGGVGSPLDMTAVKVSERMADGGIRNLVVCGTAESRALAREHFSRFENVQEFALPRTPPGVCVAAGAGELGGAAEASAVIGLLLPKTRAFGRLINLIRPGLTLPWWAENVRFLFERKKAIPLAVALFALLCLSSIATNKVESRLYARAVAKSPDVAAHVAAAEANWKTLRDYQRARVPLLDILLEITKSLPNGVLLNKLSIDKNGEIEMAGKCPSYASAEEIAAKLNKSSLFTKAVTGRMGGVGKGGVSFRTTCSLKRKPGSRE
ncbi:MAG TPA: PilN domain-containing protein, partial [Sumerlaeia bacterium]|nr:PilN domain-containing protein [Sumerlaeia bacterium]